MIYRRDNLYARHRFKTGRWFVGVAIVFLALLIFAGPLLARIFGGPFFLIAKPVWAIRDLVVSRTTGLSALISAKQSLWAENEKLRHELAAAQAVVVDRDNLIAEATALRVETGLVVEDDPFVVAKVISNSLTSPYDVLVVDLGRSNSRVPVAVGDLVTYHNSVALGSVVAVSATTAKVSLFSTGGTELPVVLGTSRIPTFTVGRGAGNFLIQLPRTLEVSTNDAVLMSSPKRDYILGKVGAIAKTPSDTLQSILVRSPLNTHDILYVEIHPR